MIPPVTTPSLPYTALSYASDDDDPFYFSAEQVLVWLWPAEEGSDEVMEAWQKVGQRARELGIEAYYTLEKWHELARMAFNPEPKNALDPKLVSLALQAREFGLGRFGTQTYLQRYVSMEQLGELSWEPMSSLVTCRKRRQDFDRLKNEIKAGDVVVVFCGGRIPFVLRPLPCQMEHQFALIGEAYCDGSMDGECAEEGASQDLFLV
jgi:hypothetical protein